MSLRNSSAEGVVFDSVFTRISHMTPSFAPHDVDVCINQPMRTCSLRQPGNMAPTPDSETTASFTAKWAATWSDGAIGRYHQPVFCSPCTKQSQVQVFISPDSRPSPSVLHRSIMSHRSTVPPYVCPAQATPNQNIQPPSTYQYFQASTTNSSYLPAVSQTVPAALPPSALSVPSPASYIQPFPVIQSFLAHPTAPAPAMPPTAAL